MRTFFDDDVFPESENCTQFVSIYNGSDGFPGFYFLNVLNQALSLLGSLYICVIALF